MSYRCAILFWRDVLPLYHPRRPAIPRCKLREAPEVPAVAALLGGGQGDDGVAAAFSAVDAVATPVVTGLLAKIF